MTENYELSFTPVLVVDLRAVFGRNGRLRDLLFLIGHKNSFSLRTLMSQLIATQK
jgi:hypothetical protein